MKRILILALLFCASIAYGAPQEIKLIVPFSPGGSNDHLSRLVANRLSNPNYNFVIEYRLGAGGSVAANYVANTKNESVFMITSNGLIANPMINRTDKYNVERDFQFVSYLGAEPLIVVVPASSPIENFKDFFVASKSKQMPYGSGGIGTSSHIVSEIIANQNPNFTHIPYKGGAAVLVDFLAGRVTWLSESDTVLDPYIKDNRARPIGVFYHSRLAQYPGVPTIRESGIDDRDFYRWHIMVANADANPAVVAYVQRRLREPQIRADMRALGLDTAPPKNTANFLKTETVKTQKIIQDFNIGR